MGFFQYGDQEITYLKLRDDRLAKAIEEIGHIDRVVNPDLFGSLVHAIIGQQISTKAQETIWQRFVDAYGHVTPQGLLDTTPEQIQSLGISNRKVSYILGAAEKVISGDLDLQALTKKSDQQVLQELVALNGVGTWTAEMLMIFSMQRPNIFSFGDLALHKGLQLLHGHEKIDKKTFLLYHKRYSPYASIASFYLWAIAGGAIPSLKDEYKRKGNHLLNCQVAADKS